MVWTIGIPSGDELRALKKDQLVRAAARYFSRFGYHRTNLAEVAQALHLSKSAIYHYFPDKQSLLGECARWAHDSLVALPYSRESSALERLRALCTDYGDVLAENELGFVVFCELSELSSSDRAYVLRCRKAVEGRFRDLLIEATSSGELTEGNPKLRAMMLFGALNWICKWYRPDGEFRAREIATTFFDEWIKGGGLPQTQPASPPKRRAGRAKVGVRAEAAR
ncbi:TetR/AcrR family transcriptional regulator [Bradyrhizobium sp. USDA 4461]